MSEDESSVSRPEARQKRGPDSKVAYQGRLFSIWQWQQTLFDGSTATFEQLSRPDTVLVLPVTPDGDVLFIDEVQPGTPSMLRTIGGRVEAGENPAEAASRELLEESGYDAHELRLWAAWQPVNKIDWAVYLFVAHGLTKGQDMAMDPGESISLRALPASDLLSAPQAPRLDDNEFLYQLNFARSDLNERERVARLLRP